MFSAFALEIKIACLAVVAIAGEVAGQVKVWEDVGLKALLLVALYLVVREYLSQQTTHKAEIKSTWDMHRAEIKELLDQHKKDVELREMAMEESIRSNTEALSILTGLTKEQTDYYKAVTRNIVEEKMKGTKPSLP